MAGKTEDGDRQSVWLGAVGESFVHFPGNSPSSSETAQSYYEKYYVVHVR